MLLLVVLVVTLVAVYYFFENEKQKKLLEYWKKRGVPISKIGFSNISQRTKKSQIEIYREIYNEFPDARVICGPTMRTNKPKLFVRDPEVVKNITVKDFDHFIDRPPIIPPKWEPLWDKNLFAINGHKWREIRTILTPAFTSSKMKMMFASIEENSKNFAKHFSDMNQEIVEVEMKDVASRYTNDIIATNAFGIKVDSLKEPDNKFYRMGNAITTFKPTIFMMLRRFFLLLQLIIPRRVFNAEGMKFFFDIINETVITREAENIVRPDMIHLMIEARKGTAQVEEKGLVDTGFATTTDTNAGLGKPTSGKNLTNTDIAAQALVFFFAGFDSVSAFLTLLAYELAANPDVQDRLREEIREIWKGNDGKVTYESVMKMKYMDMVVSESLRKWPNIPTVDRECVKEYTIQPASPGDKPLVIDKGTVLTIPTFSFHRDPKYYPYPEKFDPERFNDENRKNIIPYTYFPFGVGPRNCIGSRFALMEGKMLFFHLLKDFEIVRVAKTPNPPRIAPMRGIFSIEGGMHLGFKRIKN